MSSLKSYLRAYRLLIPLDPQVHTAAGAKHVPLSDAPNGCTVTARPVDCVLVRARVCQEAKSSENILSPASTTLASAASSPGYKFAQVPLGSTWSEAIEAVKLGLGVPANRRVEARRLMSRYDDHGVQSRGVGSLFNGDVVELSVVDGYAWFETGDNFGIGEQTRYRAVEPSKEAMAVPSPAASRHQSMSEALGKSSNSARCRKDDRTRSPHFAVFDPIISAAYSSGGAMASSASSRSKSRVLSSVTKVAVPWNHQKPPEQLTAGRSSISTSANAEEEAAVAELVGMGFDRQHVVKALRECGKGDGWKEAAISVLLEPQMSGVEASEVDPEVGLMKHIGTASQRWVNWLFTRDSGILSIAQLEILRNTTFFIGFIG